MTTTLSQLEKLKEKKAMLTARTNSIEARTKHIERKQDTRKKILIGSYYLEQANKNNSFDDIKTIMDKYLTRNSDRKLFDLSKIEE